MNEKAIKKEQDTELKRKRNNFRRRKPRLAVVYIAVLALLYVIIFVFPRVTGFLTSTYVAQYGELRVVVPGTGYIIRDEKVYGADQGGELKREATEGQLIRKGESVVTITKGADGQIPQSIHKLAESIGSKNIGKTDGKAPAGGIVSYWIDGLESKLTPKSINKLKLKELEELGKSKSVQLAETSIAKNEPAFKIIEKSRWYMVADVDNSVIKDFKEGRTITVEFPELTDGSGKGIEQHPVRMTVVKVTKEAGKAKLVLETTMFMDQLTKERMASVSLITADVKGLIIEKSSLTKVKGQEGVYVKDKQGKYVFKPVLVLGTDKDKVAIADSYYHNDNGEKVDTVGPYEDVLRNPKK